MALVLVDSSSTGHTKGFIMTFTHDELTHIAEKWLAKYCGVVFRGLTTISYETPDAIGFRSDGSILIECKASRADFLADKKKVFRRAPYLGMGLFRYYLCPKDLIKPDELPEKWGLLYVNNDGTVRKKVGPKGNIWSANREWMFTDRSRDNERTMMYSALRRLTIRGVVPMIYDKL